MLGMISWREVIADNLEYNSESFDDIVFADPPIESDVYDMQFKNYYHDVEDGSSSVRPFVIWTKKYIYFSCKSDWKLSLGFYPLKGEEGWAAFWGGE